jgi:DNA (cytosine-5)-methyltransferase 1
VVAVKTLWFTKSRRAQSVYDHETWKEEGVVPTLNSFDHGDIRATTVICYPIQGTVIGRSDTAGPQGKGFGEKNDPMFTLDSGAGSNAVSVIPIQDGRPLEKKQNGLGVGKEGDPSYTIDTKSHQSVAASVIRRLTPVECERLQGFPDDWTSSQSDTHRYKQMGNAVTVNVIEWIGNQMRKSEENNGTA